METKEKELSVNDLMIGDLVSIRETYLNAPLENAQIDMRNLSGIYEGYLEAFAIPLTDEILEKNGFTKEHDWGGTFKIKDGLDLVHAGMFSMHSYEFCGSDNMDSACTGIYIDYVHELQHVLKQCEIEKTIVI